MQFRHAKNLPGGPPALAKRGSVKTGDVFVACALVIGPQSASHRYNVISARTNIIRYYTRAIEITVQHLTIRYRAMNRRLNRPFLVVTVSNRHRLF